MDAYAAERRHVVEFGHIHTESVAERPPHDVCPSRDGGLAVHLHALQLLQSHALSQPAVGVFERVALVHAVNVEPADGVVRLSGYSFQMYLHLSCCFGCRISEGIASDTRIARTSDIPAPCSESSVLHTLP